MPRDRYELIKLTQTTRYAGYQFHARVHVSGMQGLNRSFVLPSYVENGEWRRSPVSNIAYVRPALWLRLDPADICE